MKKRYFTALMALAVLLGTLGGCARTQSGPADEAPAEAAGPVALTAEEIARVNRAFVPNFEKDGWVDVNPLCCMVSCFYAEPEDIDLSAFLAYSFAVERGPEWEPVGEKEFQALREQADWLGESLDAWRTPISRIPRARVDAFLEKYTGITTADLTAPWTAYKLVYLEEYDAYYNFTSDFNPGCFTCEEGVRDGGTVRLTGHGRELVLEEQADGSWYFVSFLLTEAEK
nr:hypothetical protein [uncultured Oscillibacter sp.]